MIPKGNDKHIEFERDRLTNAVKRVALDVERTVARGEVSDRKGPGRHHLEQSRISARRTKSFRSTTPAARCRSASTRSMCSIFSAAVSTDVVSLDLKDEVSQAVVKPVGAEGYDYTYVIMPMRV